MLKVDYLPTADLIPYVNNSRTHSEAQVSQVAASIKEFGFTNPILVDESGCIIAGHGRLLAAKKLGLNEVPTITLEGLTEAQRKAYIIADNQLALNSGWDLDALKVEVERLTELDFDIGLLGFDDDFNNLLSAPEVELGLTPEEKLENYLSGDTKIIRLAYTQDELEQIIEWLDIGLRHFQVEDYSTLIYNLVSKEQQKWQ